MPQKNQSSAHVPGRKVNKLNGCSMFVQMAHFENIKPQRQESTFATLCDGICQSTTDGCSVVDTLLTDTFSWYGVLRYHLRKCADVSLSKTKSFLPYANQ